MFSLRLRYIASDGQCYGLDITTDRDVNQTFRTSSHTVRFGSSTARIAKIEYLLNSKAWAYLTRVGNDRQAKMAIDARDILFIIEYMRRHRVAARPSECRWVVDYDFWTLFCRSYDGAEQALQSLGLRRDATPNQSNRQSRNSSMSRSSSGNRSGGGRSR